MKTNVVMKSSDRSLFGGNIRQETKTGFLNLSDLQDVYNKQASAEGWSEKRISDLFFNKAIVERVYYILEKQGVIKSLFYDFIELVEKQTLVKVLKSHKAYRTSGARHTKTTWVNPYIWVLIAMELNPKLYAETVMWMTDSLILNRIAAGNMYVELGRQLASKLDAEKDVYMNVARAINYCVFNNHESKMRDSASTKELKEIEELEKHLAWSLKAGLIKNYDQLMNHLRELWKNKHQSKNPLI